MPNRKTHKSVGAVAGGATALFRAREQSPHCMALEALGGAIGGLAGGRLPDILEPATWPGHRNIAHSYAAGATLNAAAQKAIPIWENKCRARSEQFMTAMRDSDDQLAALANLIAALLCRVAAGVASGFVAGYTSHLALDACTPAGLPLLLK